MNNYRNCYPLIVRSLLILSTFFFSGISIAENRKATAVTDPVLLRGVYGQGTDRDIPMGAVYRSLLSTIGELRKTDYEVAMLFVKSGLYIDNTSASNMLDHLVAENERLEADLLTEKRQRYCSIEKGRAGHEKIYSAMNSMDDRTDKMAEARLNENFSTMGPEMGRRVVDWVKSKQRKGGIHIKTDRGAAWRRTGGVDDWREKFCSKR